MCKKKFAVHFSKYIHTNYFPASLCSEWDIQFVNMNLYILRSLDTRRKFPTAPKGEEG